MAREGNSNAAKGVKVKTKGPWASWSGSRAGKVIQFIESQIIVPFGNGAGHPMQLMDWQTEWIETVFSDDIKSAALSVPRSNGKTGLLAGIALSSLHLDENSPEIWLCAVTVGQLTRPSGLYGVVRRMSELNPELDNRTIVRAGNMNPSLQVPINGGVLMPISTRNKGSMQGGAVALGIADELAHLDPEDWQALVGAGLKRPDSKVMGISTPGRPNSALHALRKAVLSRAEMPGFHWTEYAAPDGCDIHDEEAWKVANPSYGVTLDVDALRSAVATTAPFLFRQYHLGQWQEVSEESWLGPDGPALWDSLQDPYQPEEDAPCWMGVDVSLKFDSTSVVSVFRRPDGRLHASAKVWYPGSGVVDQALVREHIREQADRYRVGAVAYDPRFWVASAQDLEAEGLPMVEVPQSPTRMVPIVGNAYSTIVDRKLTHDPDPTFRQQVLNAIPRPSEAGFTLYKQRQGNAFKIDACIALCLALSVTDIEPPSGSLISMF